MLIYVLRIPFLFNSADFDECQSSDACEVNHVCNNTVGSYRCECPTGFVANCSTQNPLNLVCVGKKKREKKNRKNIKQQQLTF